MNEFEKAKAKVEASAPAAEDNKAIPEMEQAKTPEPTENSNKKKKIGLDDISDENWIKLPKKSEIGQETEILDVESYENREGKFIKPKNGGDEFWTGMTRKNKTTRQTEYDDEYVLITKQGSINLPSWEHVGKLNSLMRHIKELNKSRSGAEQIKFFGDTQIQFKRIGGGSETAGNNWVLKCPTLNIQVGDGNIIEDLKE